MARESSNHDTPNLLHDASISTRIGLIPPHPLLPRGVVGDLGAASCSGCCCVKIFLVFVLCCCFLRFFSGAGQRGGKGFRSKLFDVRGHKRTNTCAQQIVHDKLTRTSTNTPFRHVTLTLSYPHGMCRISTLSPSIFGLWPSKLAELGDERR